MTRDNALVGPSISRIEEAVNVAINEAFPGSPWLATYDITIVEAESAHWLTEYPVYAAVKTKVMEINAIC